MKILNPTLRTAWKRSGYLALAGGLAFAASAYAQSSSPSFSSSSYAQASYAAQQGNGQYDNQPYPNQTYNNQRTPRYTGHSWLDHWIFEGGGGVTPAAGSTQDYANTGWNVLLGGGYKFSDRLSLLAEWNFNDLGVPHSLAGVIAGVPDGNEHLWTTDLNPKFNFIHHGRLSGYLIGGGGFSRTLVNYTAPVLFYCFDPFFGYYACSGDVTVARNSSNQGNLDIGGGAEWRLSAYERGDLFLESRYLKLFTPSNGLPPGGGAALVPVTFGYRW